MKMSTADTAAMSFTGMGLFLIAPGGGADLRFFDARLASMRARRSVSFDADAVFALLALAFFRDGGRPRRRGFRLPSALCGARVLDGAALRLRGDLFRPLPSGDPEGCCAPFREKERVFFMTGHWNRISLAVRRKARRCLLRRYCDG